MILDLIYPPVCGICNRINKKYLCEKCEKNLKPYEIYSIKPCNKKDIYYDYHIKILRYENKVRDIIIDFKFKEKAYIYKNFKKIILKNEKIYSFLKKYDIIIPVPMYKKRKWTRGYNQAELIANDIAKDIKVCIEKNNLIKIKDTKKQSTLSKNERKLNVKNAFSVLKPDKILNKKVILFDDIFTTGRTVNECSKILKKYGAKEIAVLTIAVD